MVKLIVSLFFFFMSLQIQIFKFSTLEEFKKKNKKRPEKTNLYLQINTEIF